MGARRRTKIRWLAVHQALVLAGSGPRAWEEGASVDAPRHDPRLSVERPLRRLQQLALTAPGLVNVDSNPADGRRPGCEGRARAGDRLRGLWGQEQWQALRAIHV